MRKKNRVIATWLIVTGTAVCPIVIGQQVPLTTKLALAPDEIKYAALPGAPPGVTSAIVAGDPSKNGVYVLRNKFPPNSKLLPHSHGDNWRVMTVLAGSIYFGYGEKLEDSKLKRLGPGSVILEPKDTPHYFITKDEEVLLQIVAEGPFTTKYVQ
jgi:uncharacterized RmlC-like cupin family protein